MGLRRNKELHEGDCFTYKGWNFELLYWDPIRPGDPEYGIASMQFSQEYAPDLELVIGFVPQGSTREDVEQIIAENFWQVQERIDYIDASARVAPPTKNPRFWTCEWCRRDVAEDEILDSIDNEGNRVWECPYCGCYESFTQSKRMI